MIKPEELRIGNLIHVPSTGQSIPVTAINMDLGVWVNRSLGVLGFDQIEPIPLTEEWLLKFGFEKVEHTFWIIGLAVHNNTPREFYVLYEQNRTIITSVHQLQNLFFALCGEELNLKTKQ